MGSSNPKIFTYDLNEITSVYIEESCSRCQGIFLRNQIESMYNSSCQHISEYLMLVRWGTCTVLKKDSFNTFDLFYHMSWAKCPQGQRFIIIGIHNFQHTQNNCVCLSIVVLFAKKKKNVKLSMQIVKHKYRKIQLRQSFCVDENRDENVQRQF